MRLQLFVNGPPGAGKTTLAKLLSDELALAHVSTGDVLRDNILQRTALGLEAKSCIKAQALVPDHVVVDMIAERVAACEGPGHAGWVLDGFPRTVEQAAALHRKRIAPALALVLEVPARECTLRLTGRRFDPVTSRIYHMPQRLPREPHVVARLTRRGDDAADKLPPRMEAYRQHGDATNAFYQDVVVRLDATQRPEELLNAVLGLLRGKTASSSSSSSVVAVSPGALGLSRPMASPVPMTSQSTTASTIGNQPPPAFRAKHKAFVPPRIDEEDETITTSSSRRVSSPSSDPEDPEVDATRRALLDFDYRDADDAQQQQQQQSWRLDGSNFKSLHATAAMAPAATSNSNSSSSSSSSSGGGGGGASLASPPPPPPPPQSSPSPPLTPTTKDSPSRPEVSSNNDELPLSRPAATTTATAAATPPPAANAATAAAATTLIGGVDMGRFRDLLLDGFEVLKHGRRGSPHARVIFTDMEFKRIFWMKPSKEPKAKRAKLDQSLLLQDVVQVLRGMKTEVLKRSGDVGRYERYLSLVADDRTLDMELPTDGLCEFLLRGFEQLLFGGNGGAAPLG